MSSIDECNKGFKDGCKGKDCCEGCFMEFNLCKPGNGCKEDINVTLSENPKDIGSGFVIYNPLEFINSLTVRSSSRSLQGSHGVDDSLSWYDRRVMTAEGVIFACNRCELSAYEKQLKSVLALDSNQSFFENNGYINLSFTDEDCSQKSMCVKVVDPPVFEFIEDDTCHVRRFSFTVATQNEKMLGCSLKECCGQETPFTGGFKLCGEKLCESELCFAPAVGCEVCNEGSYAASPVIKITGPAEIPRFWNLSTGDFMEINTTITSDDTIEINIENRTIYVTDRLGNQTDITGLLTDESNWIFLGPCCSEVALTTRRPDLLLSSFCIQWQDTYI